MVNMELKEAAVLLALLLLLSAGLPPTNGSGGGNFPRHIDPARIEGESPGPRPLFRIYSLNLKSISTGNWENAERFLRYADYAYLPQDLRPLNSDLLNASRNLKTHTHRSSLNIDNALTSALSADFSRAREELYEARFSLAKAERDLRNVDQAGEDLGVEMGGLPGFFTENLRAVENLLEAYNSTIRVLKEGGSLENVPDVPLPTDNLQRVENLIGENVEGRFPGIHELAGGENLVGTEITIGLDRDAARVGTRVKVKGSLRTEDGKPLAGRNVSVYLGGRTEKNVLTDGNGRYSARVRIPYLYRDEVSLRSVYLPRGEDLGTFAPAASREASLDLLYGDPSLEIEAPEEVYPGRSFEATGSLTLRGEPLPGFSVKVHWLGTAENIETGPEGSFSADLSVPPRAAEGPAELRAESLPEKTVGPGSAMKTVRITRLDPSLSFKGPGLSLLGADLTVTGKVMADGGPVENSKVLLEMGGRTASTRSSGEGRFKASLRTSLSNFSGKRSFSIRVYPGKPWIKATVEEGEVFLLNPLTILVVLIAAASLLVLWRSGGESEAGPTESVEAGREEPAGVEGGEELEGIKGFFVRGVKAVAEATGLSLKKSQTIREYLSDVRGKIGRAYEPFERLGLKFEEHLYSDHEVEEDPSLLDKIFSLLGRAKK